MSGHEEEVLRCTRGPCPLDHRGANGPDPDRPRGWYGHLNHVPSWVVADWHKRNPQWEMIGDSLAPNQPRPRPSWGDGIDWKSFEDIFDRKRCIYFCLHILLECVLSGISPQRCWGICLYPPTLSGRPLLVRMVGALDASDGWTYPCMVGIESSVLVVELVDTLGLGSNALKV